MDGAWIVPIDKPPGLSSAQVVSRVKRRLSQDKVGHCGTLDPFATGVLVCVTGRATRLASFCEAGVKEYSGTIRLGINTTTDDTTGEVINSRSVSFSAELLANGIQLLKGEIEQVPPNVSAIKINGVPAYTRVRKGEVVEISPRRVVVEEFKVTQIADDLLSYWVRCSKGTYIRSLARDLGETLGCGAAVETLRRERVGPYDLGVCCELDRLEEDKLLPWWSIFSSAPIINLPQERCRDLARGEQRFLADLHGGLPLNGEGPVLYADDSERPQGLLTVSKDGVRCFLHVGDGR